VLAAGDSHACAQTHARKLLCWGWNKYGQLGDGTTRNRHKPVAVSGIGTGLVAVAAGLGHTCALTDKGKVKCWGENKYGQLGDGTTTNRHTPVAVAGLKGVAAIAAGNVETCALTRAGRVKCWGENRYGQLGDGTTTDRHAPVLVSALGSANVAIAVGGNHACAITNSHAVKCWGRNDHGQLGNGTLNDSHQPGSVVGLTNGVVGIATGHAHTCARKNDGSVVCWGWNVGGQLGNGTRTDARIPLRAFFHVAALSVAAGSAHTCARESGGGTIEVFECVGDNQYGQLGDKTKDERAVPVHVYGLSSVGQGTLTIGSGAEFTCARVTRVVACWGRNRYGQLGDGTTVNRDVATAVKVLDCVVPNVVGRTLTAAKVRIVRAYCRLGKVTTAKSKKKIGTVVRELPRAGYVFQAGRKVNLVVSRGNF
jgi:alpha-tubulin suppressor-like RCC1 family protein